MKMNPSEGSPCSGNSKLSNRSHQAKRNSQDRIRWIMDKIKGSHHDSLFYLGGIAVLMFIFLFAGIGVWGFDKNEDFALMPSLLQAAPDNNSLFVGNNAKKVLEPPAFILVQNSSVKPALPTAILEAKALGALVGTTEEAIAGPRSGIVEYVVEKGDTVSSLAERFGLSADTILVANGLKKGSALQVGKTLIILPVDGLVHHVKSGETISEIARTYQAKTDEVVAFNNLASAGDIFVGDILIIPGGKMPVVKPKSYAAAPSQVPLASSYFICPLGSSASCGRLTQGLHWYNAVDIDGECGDPIYAAAAGQVLKVALTNSTSKWALNGAGNHITVLHPNGVVTYYGHLRTSLVSPGQQVSQGQMVATVGGQPGTPGAGLSTGCHIHFGVTGARNPFAR